MSYKMESAAVPRYKPSALDDIEDIENYVPGGFHPVHIGDIYQSRYKVLHKLGYGGYSTVWLARDTKSSTYVAVKIIEAQASSFRSELEILKKLSASKDQHVGKQHVVTLLDDFEIEGPNGRHLCLVTPVAGPSISCFNQSPDGSGRKRLRGDLARNVARQTAQAVDFIHSQRYCHGGKLLSTTTIKINDNTDRTTDVSGFNVLLTLDESFNKLSEAEIYQLLGKPMTAKLETVEGSPPGPSAPTYIIEADTASLCKYLAPNIILVNFGCAFPSLILRTHHQMTTD
jgi:serine/threonine-protein kinase SRPK3